MIISSVSATSSDSLLSKLETNGLSASKAQLVESDLSQVEASLGSSTSSSGAIDMQTMRAALDKKIDDDVASGQLSQSDAEAVKKTLDQLDSQTSGASDTSTATTTGTTTSAQSDSSSAAQESGGGGGGGGAGGTSGKTEVSETVTITGPLKTTVITYSDGSTATTTTVATETDEQKYGKQQATQAAASTTAMKYLSTIAPGTLFSQMA